MTERLYWKKPYEKEFTAKITQITDKGIILDKTLFYPQGGGQESDRGVIKKEKEIFTIDMVSQEDDIIIHYLSSHLLPKLKVGEEIKGEIDWEFRYGIMKAHSSQHLLSAVLLRNYNVKTTRTFINYEDVTIQLDKKIEIAELKKVLQEVNQFCTTKNVPINDEIFHSKEEITSLDEYRGNVPVKENLRLVVIEDMDKIFCGGTHVKSTMEIGPLFVYDFKKGTELKYLVGKKAIVMLTSFNLDMVSLSIQMNKTLKSLKEAINNSIKQIQDLEREKEELIFQYLMKIAKHPNVSIGTINISEIELDINHKYLMKIFKDFPPDSVLIFKLNANRIKIVSNTQKLNANKIVQSLIRKYGGKGGGSPSNAQGILEKIPGDMISETKELISGNK